MTDLEIFKRRVGYQTKSDQDTFTANGSALTVDLRHENVDNVQVYIGSDLQSGASYTVENEPGRITFADAPADGAVVTINYTFAPLTDAEANELIQAYGLDVAVVEALRAILASTAKLLNYKQGDTEVDNSQVFKQVKSLLEYYEKQTYKDESGEASGLAIRKRNDPRGDANYREKDYSRLYGEC